MRYQRCEPEAVRARPRESCDPANDLVLGFRRDPFRFGGQFRSRRRVLRRRPLPASQQHVFREQGQSENDQGQLVGLQCSHVLLDRVEEGGGAVRLQGEGSQGVADLLAAQGTGYFLVLREG